MTNRWCSIPTLTPTYPSCIFRCREKLKQVNPCFSIFFVLVLFCLFPPLPSSLFPSSTSGHLSLFTCLPFSLFLPLFWSLHGSGWKSPQASRWTHICHSSHPTIDSGLYPLTLSPLHFSGNTMSCMQRGYTKTPLGFRELKLLLSIFSLTQCVFLCMNNILHYRIESMDNFFVILHIYW